MCYQWSLHLKASALYHESRITQLKVTVSKLDNTVNHKIRSFNSEILKSYILYESTLFFTLLHSSHLIAWSQYLAIHLQKLKVLFQMHLFSTYEIYLGYKSFTLMILLIVLYYIISTTVFYFALK